MNGENKYDDIINLPHHTSESRKHMSLYDRAAQFSPFAALTGHDDALQETARLTHKRAELDESEKAVIGEKLQQMMNANSRQCTAEIIYYVPDEKKSGGAYLKKHGAIRKIDSFAREVVMRDGTIISVDNIYGIEILEEFNKENELYL